MIRLAPCPECGELAEIVDDDKIWCESCWTAWFMRFQEAIGGENGIGMILAQIEQDTKLGIGLDCEPREMQ